MKNTSRSNQWTEVETPNIGEAFFVVTAANDNTTFPTKLAVWYRGEMGFQPCVSTSSQCGPWVSQRRGSRTYVVDGCHTVSAVKDPDLVVVVHCYVCAAGCGEDGDRCWMLLGGCRFVAGGIGYRGCKPSCSRLWWAVTALRLMWMRLRLDARPRGHRCWVVVQVVLHEICWVRVEI